MELVGVPALMGVYGSYGCVQRSAKKAATSNRLPVEAAAEVDPVSYSQ
jgi:hypothetical protein